MLLFRQHPFGDCIIAHPVVTTTAAGEYRSWDCDYEANINDLSNWLTPEDGWACFPSQSLIGRAFGSLFDSNGLADAVIDLGYDVSDGIDTVVSFLRRFQSAQNGLQSPFDGPLRPCYLVIAAEHGRFYVRQTEGPLKPLVLLEGEASYGVIPDSSESVGKRPTFGILWACISIERILT